MRVLAGGPAREVESELYRLHVRGLEAQDSTGLAVPAPGGVRINGLQVVVRHEVVADPGGPRWHGDKIERVARARQAMMDRAAEMRLSRTEDWFDGLLMVDTDVILGPGVLERLWAVDADVVYGVFWTESDWGQPRVSPVAPQVWWTHPYDWKDLAALNVWNQLCEPGVNEVEVKGGGACTLIRGRGFESQYWPLLDSLKGANRLWPGEDRTYCLGLECRGLRQVAVTGLPIVHLYDASLQTPEKLSEAKALVGLTLEGVE